MFFFQPASAIRLLSSKDGQSLTWCSHHRFTTSFLVYHVFFHFWMPTRFGMIPWNAMGYATLFYQVGGIDDAKISILENQQQPTNSTNQPIQPTNGHTSRLQISNKNSSSFGGGSFFGGCMTQGKSCCSEFHGPSIWCFWRSTWRYHWRSTLTLLSIAWSTFDGTDLCVVWSPALAGWISRCKDPWVFDFLPWNNKKRKR